MTLRRRILNGEEMAAMRQAEEHLLGAILIQASDGDSDRTLIDQCAFIVKPSDFTDWNDRFPLNIYQCQNGRIYSAMLTCSESPHIVNVAAEMVKHKILNRGDLAQMVHCQAEVPTYLDWNDYAIKVRYYSQLRRSVVVGGEMPKNQMIRGGVTLDPM